MIKKEALLAKCQEVFPHEKYIVMENGGAEKASVSQEEVKETILDLVSKKGQKILDRELFFGAISEDLSECIAITNKFLFVFSNNSDGIYVSNKMVIHYDDIVDIRSSYNMSDVFKFVIHTKNDYSKRRTGFNNSTTELSGDGITIANDNFFSADIISRIFAILSFAHELGYDEAKGYWAPNNI